MAESQNYTVGRGEVFFDRFTDSKNFVTTGELYIGNTPQFNMNNEATNLDHYSSDRGIRVKDESVVLQTNRTINLITDSIRASNVAMFFFGDSNTLVAASETASIDTIIGVLPGAFYQIGVKTARPQGARKVANVAIAPSPTGAAFVEGTDYVLDAARGRFQVVSGGAITKGVTLKVTYDVTAHSRAQVISGTVPVEGTMRYVAHNAEGDDLDYFFPYVKIRSNGDYALKSEEWQQLPLAIDVMTRPGMADIYMDGQPFTP